MNSAPEATELAGIAHRHLDGWSPAQVHGLFRCFDMELARRRFVAARLCDAEASDADVLRAYFERTECRRISPNAFFDELWYRKQYPDVDRFVDGLGITGFSHFLVHGIPEGRWPNEALWLVASRYGDPEPRLTALDANEYLRLNASARVFLEAFPILSALEHYNLYGRFLHLATAPASETRANSGPLPFLAMMEREFDPEFYAREYLSGSTKADRIDPFRHYLTVGIERQYSPNAWFQEDWYRAYYADVRAAIPGRILCAFQHYLSVGRTEHRLPRFDITASLEARLPGVTAPALITRAHALRTRAFRNDLRAYRRDPREGVAPTFWFLLPTLNPDIAFGGYRACFELMRALRTAGARVSVYCTEDKVANKGYFLWRERSEAIRNAFDDIEVLGGDQDDRLAIGQNDRIVVFTVLDLHLAHKLAAWTTFGRPYLLAQEYEPVFFDNSSARALSHESYGVPHFAIVNSAKLLEFFRKSGIGAFAPGRNPKEFEDFAVFEHRINQLPRQTAAAMRARKRKVLAVYARPELHASRNLFELTLLALENLCERGVFDESWSFAGLGALSDIEPLPLGRGHRLVLHKRTSEEEYRELMEAMDIGISMMYAPHPGVVALEFATTGALVITNVYENRSSGDLREFSNNLIPCEPTLADLERAIVEAVGRVADYDERERSAYRPPLRSWDEIFSPDFIDRVFRIHAHAP
jgi:hypothetical protein